MAAERRTSPLGMETPLAVRRMPACRRARTARADLLCSEARVRAIAPLSETPLAGMYAGRKFDLAPVSPERRRKRDAKLPRPPPSLLVTASGMFFRGNETGTSACGGACAYDLPEQHFHIPETFRGSCFFAVLDAQKPEGTPARNFYIFRCMDNGNARTLRDQLAETPAHLELQILKQEERRITLRIKNSGKLPSAITSVSVPDGTPFAADDSAFWLDPDESKDITLRFPGKKLPAALAVSSWNSPKITANISTMEKFSFFSSTGG